MSEVAVWVIRLALLVATPLALAWYVGLLIRVFGAGIGG